MRSTRIIHCALIIAAACAGAVAVPRAMAATATSNLSVSATVANSCVIDTTSALAFGTYDAGADLAASNGSLTLFCTQSAVATIVVSQGLNPASGSNDAAPLRQMAQGNATLAYRLYQDAGHTTAWGNTLATALQRIASGNAEVIPVYGVVPRGQAVPAGSYTDIVVVTVTF